MEELKQQIEDLTTRHREFSARLAERESLRLPADDPDFEDVGPAFPAWTEPARGAILQPPKPQIYPSELTLDRIADRDLSMEAAD